MNNFNFQDSLKNIPLPSKKQYLGILVEKIEKFVTNMRRVWLYKNKSGENSIENFKFKSPHPPPPVRDLADFEEDLYKLAKNIEFRPVRNEFQQNLSNKIKKINDSQDIIIKADKSRNLYSVPVHEYNKLLQDNITSEYKKSDHNNVIKVNKEAANIAKKLKIDDRVDQYIESDAFITIKDHKPNFPSRIQCRLINPAKSNIGQISKSILEKKVKTLKTTLNYNQWRNSDEVISWFKNLNEKQNLKFIKFDIVSFYPSISEQLFSSVIDWANNLDKFTPQELEVITNSRKSFLFNESSSWVKKNNENFDVTMGSFDGAEACELVGLFILDKTKAVINEKHIGLYRDDGLAAVSGSGPQVERKRKQLCQIFQQLGLKITSETNLKECDFLDIYFNLTNNSYKPFRKANNIPVYINAQSNHPKTIKQNLPQMISDRISKLSSTQQIYEEEIQTYKDALKNAGYSQNITYNKVTTQKKNRKRNILWFNPPFSETVKTNVGAKFLSLIDKHFKKDTPLGKVFNRNTVKISYSCLPNISSIISGHNRKIIKQQTQTPVQQFCSCRQGTRACPLEAKCLEQSIIYKATVKSDNSETTYIGSAGNSFKERYTNHTSSFRNRKYEHSTTLSKFIWTLKDQKKAYNIEWKQIQKAPTYDKAIKKCKLCNAEKTQILFSIEPNLLNKRSELMNKCRHRNKHTLYDLNK